MTTTLKIRDLRLADVVRLSDGDYMTATVCQVTEDEVILVRPYIHTADFSYTGGVITYIGQETVKLCRDSNRELLVYRRKDLK